MDRKQFVENQLKSYKEKWGLDISVSFDMPKGFETAFGMFDVTKNVLFVSLSSKIDDARFLFTFYHELRHALQYNFPEMFGEEINMTLPFVVHFDGNCYMLKNNKWVHCKIEDENLDFMEIYKSLPYEIDANNFAYEQSCIYANDIDKNGFDEMYKRSLPTKKYNINDLMKICEIIKNKCKD